jgi:hypothetical protein
MTSSTIRGIAALEGAGHAVPVEMAGRALSTWSCRFAKIWLLPLAAFLAQTRRVNVSATLWRLAPAVEPIGPIASEPASESSADLVRDAEALGLPWQRILREEIEAEHALRRLLEDVDGEWPLEAGLKILPASFLRSWRMRDRLHALWARSRVAFDRKARGQLRRVVASLLGKVPDDPNRTTLAEHRWFAYQRVLLLQRVSRAAERSRGNLAERLAFVCDRARCRPDDAAWAVALEDAPRRGHRLDAAIRKAREEGFQIPRAATEARAFAALREMVRVSPLLSRGRRPAAPRGVPSPADRF